MCLKSTGGLASVSQLVLALSLARHLHCVFNTLSLSTRVLNVRTQHGCRVKRGVEAVMASAFSVDFSFSSGATVTLQMLSGS